MTLAALNLLAFRLAHRARTARTARTALAGRSRSGGQANQLLRPHPHVERLRNLSLLAGFPPIPRHLLDPAEPHKTRRQPVNVEKVPTSRIAGNNLRNSPLQGKSGDNSLLTRNNSLLTRVGNSSLT